MKFAEGCPAASFFLLLAQKKETKEKRPVLQCFLRQLRAPSRSTLRESESGGCRDTVSEAWGAGAAA